MSPKQPTEKLSLIQLIPNMLTVLAICAGLTAIRFATQDNFEWAVKLVLVAAVLDGLDGRIARLLNSESKMGGELDSLADFLNFGVATGLILYFWALTEMSSLGWLAVLIYATCCVLRLARFNVARKDEPEGDTAYFLGIPSPAGALLAMLPMFIAFSTGAESTFPGAAVALWMALIGFMMISRVPTWSFKKTRIPKVNVKYFLVGFVFVAAAVTTFAWQTLVILCFIYLGVIAWGLMRFLRLSRNVD